jgi:hypothetical protein
MDQDAFRKTYREVNERFCAYEKSVLTNQCECSQADRFCIAEREGVHCNSDIGQARCLKLLALLREQARFALRTASEEKAALPHGKAIRIQVGGLRGLHAVLDPDQPVPEKIADIYQLIQRAEQAFGELEALPFSEVMPQIAAYRGRTRSRRRPRH